MLLFYRLLYLAMAAVCCQFSSSRHITTYLFQSFILHNNHIAFCDYDHVQIRSATDGKSLHEPLPVRPHSDLLEINLDLGRVLAATSREIISLNMHTGEEKVISNIVPDVGPCGSFGGLIAGQHVYFSHGTWDHLNRYAIDKIYRYNICTGESKVWTTTTKNLSKGPYEGSVCIDPLSQRVFIVSGCRLAIIQLGDDGKASLLKDMEIPQHSDFSSCCYLPADRIITTLLKDDVTVIDLLSGEFYPLVSTGAHPTLSVTDSCTAIAVDLSNARACVARSPEAGTINWVLLDISPLISPSY